ncbi:MAG: DUF559 domain-containing protein [Acidimicrobiaceae bacterium]|nr:DUF559 domain-containing protein [Acidimicrobiaceae bacterium]MBO0894447.1 DUF559 domain-containing protein [Acidimicrobiales bacterium]
MRDAKEHRLTRWLAGHHGVITADEALLLGVSSRELRALVHHGRLHRVHPRVYAEVHRREHPAIVASAAALAAAGPRAALSHGSAAWAWDMVPEAPARVHLLVPYGGEHRLAQVQVHRTRSPFASRSRQGLRVTDPIRTLIDLAAQSPTQVSGAIDRVLAQKLVRFSDLATTVDHTGTALRGVATLRTHLYSMGYLGAPAPSVLESHMARLISRSGLPAPEVEYVAGDHRAYRLDFAYPALKLCIEVDGYAWHHDPAKVAYDHARRNRLRIEGWQILVYTWSQVRDDPDQVVAEIVEVYRRLAA